MLGSQPYQREAAVSADRRRTPGSRDASTLRLRDYLFWAKQRTYSGQRECGSSGKDDSQQELDGFKREGGGGEHPPCPSGGRPRQTGCGPHAAEEGASWRRELAGGCPAPARREHAASSFLRNLRPLRKPSANQNPSRISRRRKVQAPPTPYLSLTSHSQPSLSLPRLSVSRDRDHEIKSKVHPIVFTSRNERDPQHDQCQRRAFA